VVVPGNHKIPAAVAFARANKLNRISHDSRNARFGIAAMGKTWRDMLQALEDLGLDRGMLEALGIRILKVAMPWPVDRDTYAEFADGLDDILVIEDKREQIENALRDVSSRSRMRSAMSAMRGRSRAGRGSSDAVTKAGKNWSTMSVT
jgi:TPP-dependent indolepyruvate ferredoxin oxidoreductase alpha subunit